MDLFVDRDDAARRLAPLLERYRRERPIVLGLPRGGVPIAREVARALGAPLDVLIVRKLGAPIQPELGMGAIAEGGARFIDPEVVSSVGATDEDVDAVVRAERAEIERRVRRYRHGRRLTDVRGRTVILVDDGIATGGTVRAGIRALRTLGARKIVVAAPVAASETAEALAREADELVFVEAPEDLRAIGLWYERFDQISDEDVLEQLESAHREAEAPAEMQAGDASTERLVRVEIGPVELEGNLRVPRGAEGIVVFAHGSGSSRLSRRNRYVAEALNQVGLATLLFDLLTADEEREDEYDAHLRFDIPLLAGRLAGATVWLERQPATQHLRIGYFGASTGAAAALVAASGRAEIAAIVSRGGRPDLADDAIEHVFAPTLLIVGGQDLGVIELNQSAYAQLRGEKRMVLVPGATHLFEEPGALDEVASLAAAWFLRHLGTRDVVTHP